MSRMHCEMHLNVILLTVFLMFFLTAHAIPCDSCGNECANACGTKHFRTCCFNYLRKRADPDALKLSTNKRLIDFILLQGRALFTQNELSRAEARRNSNYNNNNNNISNNNKNNTQQYIDVGLQSYYG